MRAARRRVERALPFTSRTETHAMRAQSPTLQNSIRSAPDSNFQFFLSTQPRALTFLDSSSLSLRSSRSLLNLTAHYRPRVHAINTAEFDSQDIESRSALQGSECLIIIMSEPNTFYANPSNPSKLTPPSPLFTPPSPPPQNHNLTTSHPQPTPTYTPPPPPARSRASVPASVSFLLPFPPSFLPSFLRLYSPSRRLRRRLERWRRRWSRARQG